MVRVWSVTHTSNRRTAVNKILKFLSGKKSYIIGAAVFVLAGLQAIGKIDEATAQKVMRVLEGAFAFSLRAAIAKGK